MIAGLVLAACLNQPLFDMTGPVCPPERQGLECECSECFTWDPELRATRYEIRRQTVSSGAYFMVGTIAEREFTDEDTGLSYRDVPELWCTAKDDPFPRAGTRYRYSVRACNAYGCGEFSNDVEYAGAPYACYEGAGEIQCYPGDPTEIP